MVDLGFFFWDLDHGGDMLRLVREIAPALPRSAGVLVAALNAPPAPFVPEQHHSLPATRSSSRGSAVRRSTRGWSLRFGTRDRCSSSSHRCRSWRCSP